MAETAHARSPSDNLRTMVQQKRILVSLGSGGVGKTTVAAALGLLATRDFGRRTLVMTIDPARRLATSLGLEGLGHDERQVPAEKLAPHGVQPGLLHAMMLDPKRTFDAMVERHAPDAATAQRLLGSKLYRQISTRLAGAQEYAAMETLHATRRAETYDLLVLDTPPTANAIDFLEAPQKMVDAVESPAVSLFVNAYRKSGRLNLGVLGFGAAYVVRRLARFTGGGFLDDIAAFLSELSGLLGGMHDRAAEVVEMLGRDEVGFVIVTSPDPRAIDEALGLYERLGKSPRQSLAFVVNRVHRAGACALDEDQTAERLRGAGLGPAPAARLAPVLLESYRQLQALAQADAVEVERLRTACGDHHAYVLVPLFDEDVHDVRALAALADALR